MSTDLRRFFKHSAIYTVGNVIYRAASFVLIPLYAHLLSPSEFGTLEILTVTVSIFQTLFASGIAHTALRFYFEHDDPQDRNRVISTALLSTFTVCTIGAAALCVAAPELSRRLLGSADYTLAFRLAFITLVLEVSREISLAVVRAKEQSGFFVVISVVQLVVQVSANLFTVVHLRLGVVGILAGNLTATFTIWVILTINTVRTVGLSFNTGELRRIALYMYPLMLGSVVGTLLNSGDRYILKIDRSLAATGVYALALRLSQVIPVLLLDPFQKSFGPFRFSIMRQPEAKEIYARVLTFYSLLASVMVLGIVSFGPDIVRLVADESFGQAGGILPVVLIPFALGGITYVFQTGIYIQKSTKSIFWIGVWAGVLDLASNWFLIPKFGIYGAAWAGVISAMVPLVGAYIVSNRLYPVRYPIGTVIQLIAVTVVAGLATSFLRDVPIVLRLSVTAVILAVHLLVCARIAKIDLAEIRAMAAKLRR